MKKCIKTGCRNIREEHDKQSCHIKRICNECGRIIVTITRKEWIENNDKEILPMSPAEINEAVARKLGWKCISLEGLNAPYSGPDYCHSLEAAREIVERPGFSWQIFRYANGSYSANLFTGEPPKARYYEAEANTAPMAICLAFLKMD